MRGGYPPGIDPPQGGGGGGFPTDSIGPYRRTDSFIGPTNIRGGWPSDTTSYRGSQRDTISPINSFFRTFDLYAPCAGDPSLRAHPGDSRNTAFFLRIGTHIGNYLRGHIPRCDRYGNPKYY